MNNLIFIPYARRDHWQILTVRRDYVLSPSGGNIGFFGNLHSEKQLSITGRNLHSADPEEGYNPLLVETLTSLLPDSTVVEVGAGIGELVPYLVTQRILNKRPVIIDPANYELMMEMLGYAKMKISGKQRKRVDELGERCRIITDYHKVQLVNMFLEEALENNQDLLGTADVVIDNFGAHHWAYQKEEAKAKAVEQLETMLLKPGGLLYSHWPAKPKRKVGEKLVVVK